MAKPLPNFCPHGPRVKRNPVEFAFCLSLTRRPGREAERTRAFLVPWPRIGPPPGWGRCRRTVAGSMGRAAHFTRGRSLVRSQVRPWLYERLLALRSAFEAPCGQCNGQSSARGAAGGCANWSSKPCDFRSTTLLCACAGSQRARSRRSAGRVVRSSLIRRVAFRSCSTCSALQTRPRVMSSGGDVGADGCPFGQQPGRRLHQQSWSANTC